MRVPDEDGLPTPAVRLLVALAAACVAATAGYAAVRCAEVALFAQVNPRAVLGATQSPFLWRCAIALYLGGAGGFGGHALVGRAPAAAARWVARAAIVAAMAIAAQAALVP